MSTIFQRLLRHEAAAGVLLLTSAILAMMVANSGLAGIYQGFLDAKFSIAINGNGLDKPLYLWINDGLMAIFFFLVGLELKREMLEGKLKNPRNVLLPGLGAIAGMAIPAAVFAWFNWGSPTIRGWAIPAATDIAFAVGILALVGSRAPSSLKVFLLTLAILDDIGAILIIALFYTSTLNIDYLYLALIPLTIMVVMNLTGIHRTGPMILLAVVMWFFVLKSGVHATIAGVVAACCIPLQDRWGKSPLHSLEHLLADYVNFLILPIFAFANAGVILAGISLSDFLEPLPLGIALGLLLGKQVAVTATTWLTVRLRIAPMPHDANFMHIYGVSCLCGVGFTMSLFIGGLSFSDPTLTNGVRLGVLTGSFLSGIIGYTVLMLASLPAQVRHATTG